MMAALFSDSKVTFDHFHGSRSRLGTSARLAMLVSDGEEQNTMNVTQNLARSKTERPVPQAPWTYGDMTKATLIVVVLSIVAGAIAAVIADSFVEAGQNFEDNAAAFTVVLAASFIAQEIFLLGAALWFGPRKYHLPQSVIGLKRPEQTPWWFSWALAAFALIIANGYVGVLALAGIDSGASTPEQVFDNAGPFIVVFVGAVLMAPVMEEVFFRGFIFGGLWRRQGWIQAGVASSLLFGFAHLAPIFVPPFAAIGFLFAWSYRRTGSLVPGMFAHGITNAVSVGLGLATSGALLWAG
jgi:membrane protease YdiL (CAAX protease family)